MANWRWDCADLRRAVTRIATTRRHPNRSVHADQRLLLDVDHPGGGMRRNDLYSRIAIGQAPEKQGDMMAIASAPLS